MAFNPFNWFRKYQKAIFVVLTVMCMIVFILQFGAGDAFTRVLNWLGAGRSKGQTVQTLNGKRVSEQDLERLAAQRRLATHFIAFATNKSPERSANRLLKKIKEDDDKGKKPLLGLEDVVTKVQQSQNFLDALRSGKMGRIPPQQLEMIVRNSERETRDSLDSLLTYASIKGVADNPERLEIIQQVGTLVGLHLWALTRNSLDEFYMGGNTQTDSLLDFVLWQQQADKLGITLTNADIAREIMVEAAGDEIFDPSKTAFENESLVTDFVRGAGKLYPTLNRTLTTRDLTDALRQEFRYAMAQGVLLGIEPGARQWRVALGVATSPAVGTPAEFLEFYREQRTTLRVKMLPVPVESFLAKVGDKDPGDDVLRKIYDRYKEAEPDPSRRSPGFREPRRIRGEYIIGDTTLPAYKEYAAKRALYLDNMCEPYRRAKLCFNAPALTPLGAGPLGRALVIAGTLVLDPMQSEYQRYLKTTPTYANPEAEGADRVDPYDGWKSLQANSAFKLGVLSATITQGNPMSSVATLFAAGSVDQSRDLAKYVGSIMLSNGSATTGPASLLTTVNLASSYVPKVLTPSALRTTIVAALEEKLAKTMLSENLSAVNKELEKLREKKAGASTEALAKVAKENHLQLYRMPRPMAELSLIEAVKKPGNDLNLGEYHKIKTRLDSRFRTAKVEELVSLFYMQQGTYTLARNSLAESDGAVLLFWLSEDISSAPRSFAAARSDVLAYWRMERAREFARDKALAIQKEINAAKGTPADAVRILLEQKLGTPFELDNVAQAIPPERETRPGVKTEYRFYRIPETLDNVFPYPPLDLPKQLMKMTRPGEAEVVADRPARTFFVAVLEERPPIKIPEFKTVYGRTPAYDGLYDFFIAQRRAEFRKNVIVQLRQEANAKLKQDNYELPENIRKSYGGRSDSSDE